jgi:hypothetical protein
MNANRKLASHLFASALRKALVDTDGRLPSAAKFADAFNLRAYGTSTITRETARKWLRGDAMPEIGKMQVLIHWLNLDPVSFLQLGTVDDNQARDVAATVISDSTDVRKVLTAILPHLDDRSVEALYLTAAAMQALKKIAKESAPLSQAGLRFIRNQEA